MTLVERDDRFEGPDGSAGLLDPFDGRRRLIATGAMRFFYEGA